MTSPIVSDTPALRPLTPVWKQMLGAPPLPHAWALLEQHGIQIPVSIEWDKTRFVAWSAKLQPALMDQGLRLQREGSATPVMVLLLTPSRRKMLAAHGLHAMVTAALADGLGPEAARRLELVRRVGALLQPASPAARTALRQFGRGLLEFDRYLRDAEILPKVPAPSASAHARLAASAEILSDLEKIPHSAARSLIRLLTNTPRKPIS